MKILFHCWEFPPNGTGVGAYVANMSKALVAAGHECVVVTGRADGLPEEEEGDHGRVLRWYDRREIGSAGVARQVLDIANRAGVDAIEGADHLGECAGLLKSSDRPPVVARIHNSNPIRVVREAEMLYPWQRPLVGLALCRQGRRYAAERKMLYHADAATVPCRRLRDELVEQGVPGADGFGVVPYPVEVRPATRDEAPAPTVLYAGRLSVGKGVHTLADTMSRVWKTFPDAVLEIAGGDAYARGLGSVEQWLRRRFEGAAGAVRFLGYLGPGELERAYRRAWVLVIPSRWDNFPFAMLDGMARGLPVVPSPHGGMPEMLEGTSCRAAEPATQDFADQVCGFLSDTGHRERAGAELRDRIAAAYAPDAVASQYAAFIEGLKGTTRR